MIKFETQEEYEKIATKIRNNIIVLNFILPLPYFLSVQSVSIWEQF